MQTLVKRRAGFNYFIPAKLTLRQKAIEKQRHFIVINDSNARKI